MNRGYGPEGSTSAIGLKGASHPPRNLLSGSAVMSSGRVPLLSSAGPRPVGPLFEAGECLAGDVTHHLPRIGPQGSSGRSVPDLLDASEVGCFQTPRVHKSKPGSCDSEMRIRARTGFVASSNPIYPPRIPFPSRKFPGSLLLLARLQVPNPVLRK